MTIVMVLMVFSPPLNAGARARVKEKIRGKTNHQNHHDRQTGAIPCCRELRALSLLLCGAGHPLTVACGAAISDPAMTVRALAELDALPALRRRRVLVTFGALLSERNKR
jgi:hypothetical protein